MKRLFLTSSVNMCAKEVAAEIGKTGLTLVFINTAAEIEEGEKSWEDDDRTALIEAGFVVTDYTISNKTKQQLESDLNGFDVIYVSGGNTFYLLQQSQLTGFIEVVRDLVINQGKIYIGTSAGSIITGPDISPTLHLDFVAMAPKLQGFVGYGFVNFCVFPHWGSEHFRELYLNHRFEYAYVDDQIPLILLTNHQYVSVQNDMYKIMEV